MGRTFGIFGLGGLLLGCGAPSAPASEPPRPSTVAEPASSAPQLDVDDVPQLTGTLPAVPEGALAVAIHKDSVKVGTIVAASLENGTVSESGTRALLRQLNVAGSANRPVAVYASASTNSATVIAVIEAVHNSGGNVVGLVAKLDGDALGWIPIRAIPAAEARPTLRLAADARDFAGISDETWGRIEGTRRLSVDVDEAMPVGALMEALHQLRGPRCAGEPGSCRFAGLEVSSGAPPNKLEVLGTLMGEGAGEGPVGLGNTGLIGNRAGVDSSKKVPRVRQAKASVSGSLDKDIIRRIVRYHINEVRYCYSKALAVDPTLKGRVAIKFRIGPTGNVADSKVETSTLPDKEVGSCIAQAVARWKFPKPKSGGDAHVTYPFVLVPG